MTRRNIELMLLLIASPIVIVLFAMMVVTGGQELSFNTLGVPLGIFAAFLVAHIAVRLLAPAADPAILPISFALSGVGIAFVTRIVPDLAVNQLLWLFIGVAAMIATLAVVRNLDKLANYKYTLMIVGILLLLSPMLPVIGYESGGGQLWLRFGSFSFQPGELAKILIVFFIAAYLAANREMLSVFTWKVGPLWLPSLATLLPLIVMWALAFVVVVLEKDLGLALVLFSVFVIMLYVATGKKLYLVVSIGLAAIAAVALYGMMGHVQTRVAIWQDPFAEAQGGGFQLVQSLYSIADGDLFGTGLPASAEPLFHRRRRPVRHRHRAGHGRSARSRGRHPRRRERLHLPRHCHRAAGVYHRRRRHAPHSPDRHHAALHQPGRLLTHRQLHHRRLPAALRRRGHRRRFRNAPDRGHRRPRVGRRAGTRGVGQATHRHHDRLLGAVRSARGEPHLPHDHQGSGVPEHAVEQPHHRERGPHGAGHHLHCRRHGTRHIGAPRGRLLQARIPRRRAGGAHRGLHLRALRHRRHRSRLQRHAARRAELRTTPSRKRPAWSGAPSPLPTARYSPQRCA